MRACYSPSPRGRWMTTPWNTTACEQALRGALAAGLEKELHLWNLNSASNSPVAPRRLSGQASANQREAETSANVNKH